MAEQAVTSHFQVEGSQRLDKYLSQMLPNHSRSRLQQLIRADQVQVNRLSVTKSSHMLVEGDTVTITIPPPEPTKLIAQDIPLDILYEDENIIVVNKPAGMVVHPSAGHQSSTLVHALLAHNPFLQGIGGKQRPGIVHRLDKDTSGVLLVAKNERSHNMLQEQFRSRKVEKVYLALVDGQPRTPSGRIEAPLQRDAKKRKQIRVIPAGQGRAAVSEFHTLQNFRQHTLLEVHPLTGRTHQIRVHLAFIGCPVVGDRVYGRRKPSLDAKRQMLHASQITLRLPDQEQARTFRAPLPQDFTEIIDQLERMER